MRSSIMTYFRIATWCCVALLAVLSLLPARYMVRTGLPGELEHFVAYAGSAAVAVVGYRRRAWMIIALFWVYASALEYLQHFSPGRGVGMADVAVSAAGALCGAVVAGLTWRHLHQ